VLALYLGAQGVETFLLTPLVQRHAVSMPPALGLLAQLLLGVLAGPLGVAFAYPIAVVALVLLKEVYLRDTLGEPVHTRQRARDAKGNARNGGQGAQRESRHD
jgi:predicted PurR-regulated permease PerM